MDIRTLFIFSVLVLVVNALSVVVTSFKVKTYPGFRHWTWFFVLLALAQVFLGLRGLVPDLFSIVLGNATALAGVLFYAQGMRLFHGLPGAGPLRAMEALAALTLAGILWYTYGEPDLGMRIVVSMSGNGLLLWIGAAWLHLKGPVRSNPPETVHFFIPVVFGAFAFLRAGNALLHPVANLFDEGWALAMFIVLLTLFATLMMISCIFLNQERTNRDLKNALEELKTLSGLIPICAGCSKIRDDSGYWQQLERYVSERTGARFSHGLCPDCALERYPEARAEIEAFKGPTPPSRSK